MTQVSWKTKWLTGARGLPPKWLLALDSHIAWGVAIPSFTAWVFHNFVLGAILILGVDLLKEIFADPFYEGLPFIWNGVEDFLEYVIGVLGAFAIGYLLGAKIF